MPDEKIKEFPEWVRDLVRVHDSALKRYAYSLCRNIDMAHDAVQHAWLRLCQHKREETEPRIPAWLFRVCRNNIVDQLRREGRMNTLPFDDHDAPDLAPGPQLVTETSDSASTVLGQVALLPPAQQEVLRLKFQGGLSYAEIAEVTERSVNAVGVLLHDAIRTLRERVRSHTDLLA